MASRSIPGLFPAATRLPRATLIATLLTTLLAALLAAGCQDRREEGSQPAPQPPVTALPPATPPAAAVPDTQAAAPKTRPAAPPAAHAPAPAAPASPAPLQADGTETMDFSLPLKPVSNPALDFASYRGRKVLVFYFGPTCPHCQQALPGVQTFAESVRARGVETIAVSTSRSNPEEIREFILKYNCRLPVFWDSERVFGSTYGVKVLPTLYVVGADGKMFKNDGYDGAPTLGLLGSRL